MAQALVTEQINNIEVQFIGYRHPHDHGLYYCNECIHIILGYILLQADEPAYISVGFKKAIQFTLDDHRDRFNFCGRCIKPLYKLVDAECRLSSPTSRQWRKLFQKRRRYGPRAGGI